MVSYAAQVNTIHKKFTNAMKKAKIPPTRKSKFRCYGGPLDGLHLYLETPSTVKFTMGKETGRYINGHWEKL